MTGSLELLDQLSVDGTPIRRELCVALASLMQQMSREQQRAMAQVWLPGFTSEGVLALSCQGAPYAIAGEGDLCALFRCVSCRYIFYPSAPDVASRGSIGRVFQSHKPEISNNVSGAPDEYYHRASAARKCLLHSLAVMPLWVPQVSRKAPIAVLEILQPDTQPDFDALQSMVITALKQVQLATVTVVAPLPDVFESMTNYNTSSQHTATTTADAAVVLLNNSHVSNNGSKPHTRASKGAPTAVPYERNVRQSREGSQHGPRAGPPPAGRVSPDNRMDQVFGERSEAADSGEHVDNVMSRMAKRPSVPVSMTANGVHANTRQFAVHVYGSPEQSNGGRESLDNEEGASETKTMHTGSNDLADRGQDQDEMLSTLQAPAEAAPEGGGGGRALIRNGSSTERTARRANGVVTRAAASDQSPCSSAEQAKSNSTDNQVGRLSRDGRTGCTQSQQAAERSLRNAMDLLAVVESDKDWQEASVKGSSLHGGSAALIACIHGSGQLDSQHGTGHEGSKRKRNDASLMPPPPPVDVGERPARREFLYAPRGESFVRASAAAAPAAQVSLHDKVARAELASLRGLPNHIGPATAPPGGAAGYHGAAIADNASYPGQRPGQHPPPSAPSHSFPGAQAGGMPSHLVPTPGIWADSAGGPQWVQAHSLPGALPSGHQNGMLGSQPGEAEPEDEETKKARNRANRVDGGIGRKVTLELLAPHFGMGLKEAAQNLGMCPTTLKRACRRLGIRRWPRKPDAVAAALERTQLAPSAGARSEAGTSADEFDFKDDMLSDMPDLDVASAEALLHEDPEGFTDLFEMLDAPAVSTK